MRQVRVPSWILLSLSVFACAHEEPRRAPMEIGQVSHELGAGDRGPEVSAVYDHLRQYGYLPNPDLERNHRHWAPVIDQEADDPGVFGPVHAAALRAFQRQAGLPETGRVDAQSLNVLKQPRCGHPENELALLDPREKWDLAEDRAVLTNPSVSWFVSSCHDNGTNFCETLATNFNAGPSGNASSVERTAFNVWQNETNKTFNRLSSCAAPCGALIDIRYYSSANLNPSSPHFTSSLNGWPTFGSATLAWGGEGPNGRWIVAVNADQDWTVDKLREVLAHEIGHVLSLSHSSTATFAPTPISWTALTVSPYTRCDNAKLPCKTVAGGARTFAAGSSFRALMASGWTVNPFDPDPVNSTSNTQVLTVDDRLAASTLWGTWKLLPGLATDIGVSGPLTNGASPPAVRLPDVWVTSGNNTIWKMTSNGGGFNQDTGANANGVAISVTPSGIPWAVGSDGQVRSRSNATCTSNPCNGTWTSRGTGARDIGIGGTTDTACSDNGTSHPCAWIVSTSALNGNFQVRRWNGTSFTSPGTAIQGVRITVDRNGFPIVLKADGTIFTNESKTGSLTWTQVKGSLPGPVGCATDIAAGLNGGLYAAGCVSAGSGNFDIWALGINKAAILDQPTTNNRSVWWPTDGIGTRVAVGPEGRAYVVQANGAIFRRDAK